MTEEDRWQLLERYGTQFEAEVAIAKLEADGIPHLLKDVESGIFGPGMAGATPWGVRLYVPESMHERAREVVEP